MTATTTPARLGLGPSTPALVTAYDDELVGRRPWGSWSVEAVGDGFKVKRLEVLPGARLSLQLHRWRAEHWVVVTGVATCTVGDREVVCGPGDTATVPEGTVHRIANHGTVPVVLVEVQVGPYLGEDDIRRLADDYGRAGRRSRAAGR